MNDFYLPPTIQEMERDIPEEHLPLIYDTAMDMLNMNTIYTGKKIKDEFYQKAFDFHVAGIKNSMERGTAIVRKKEILFFHPGTGKYVPYNKELQDYLLGFTRETIESIRRVKEFSPIPYAGSMN